MCVCVCVFVRERERGRERERKRDRERGIQSFLVWGGVGDIGASLVAQMVKRRRNAGDPRLIPG